MASFEQWYRYAEQLPADDGEELYLTVPDISFGDEAMAYRAEFLASGDSMDGTVSLRSRERAEEWLDEAAFYADPQSVITNGWVHATQLICVRKSDRRMVGAIHVRHYLNDYLSKYAGHVGYSVRPSERRKGYASWMLKHVLPYCRSIGIDSVMVTCSESNEGSRRTILANGGVYDRKEFEPSDKDWLEVYHINNAK